MVQVIGALETEGIRVGLRFTSVTNPHVYHAKMTPRVRPGYVKLR